MFETRYWIWDSIISSDLCDAIILEGDRLFSTDGSVGGSNVHGNYMPETRETNISFFNHYHWIHGICLHYANIANQNAGWNFDISYPQNVQYARYFPDQHYVPHKDDTISPNKKEMRKLSVAIQLSNQNSYEGGEYIIQSPCGKDFEIVNQFRNRGSVIVFPSVITHGIKPVIRGVRHSVVCWVVGPNFK